MLFIKDRIKDRCQTGSRSAFKELSSSVALVIGLSRRIWSTTGLAMMRRYSGISLRHFGSSPHLFFKWKSYFMLLRLPIFASWEDLRPQRAREA